MLAALLTRNPFYLALLIIVALAVNAWIDKLADAVGSPRRGMADQPLVSSTNPQSTARSRGLFIRAFVFVTLLVALFKGFSTPYGETVLFYLPEVWPLNGNPVTAEGLASAGLDALQIGATLAVFAAFSAGADYYALLRSTPPALHQVGLVTSIAITFVPQTITRFLEIREAQALRGHRIRRMGDLVPLVIPLLGGGMERSMDLAEAMEARGFSRAGANARRTSPALVQAGIAGGLGLTLAGAALFAFWPRNLYWLNWALIASGVLLVGATLWSVGRGAGRTRLRRARWQGRDAALLLLALLIVTSLLALRLQAPATLLYDPFPRLTLPTLDLLPLAICLSLLTPIFLAKREA